MFLSNFQSQTDFVFLLANPDSEPFSRQIRQTKDQKSVFRFDLTSNSKSICNSSEICLVTAVVSVTEHSVTKKYIVCITTVTWMLLYIKTV